MILERFANFLVSVSQAIFKTQVQSSYNEETISKILGDVSEDQPDVKKTVFSESEVSREKMMLFEKSLENGIASVLLDASLPGVVVPDHLAGVRDLVLNYSYKFGVRDFSFDEQVIVASLSFTGVPFKCIVPWSAVVGIANNGEKEFYTFSIDRTTAAGDRSIDSQLRKETPRREKARLRLIKGGRE